MKGGVRKKGTHTTFQIVYLHMGKLHCYTYCFVPAKVLDMQGSQATFSPEGTRRGYSRDNA